MRAARSVDGAQDEALASAAADGVEWAAAWLQHARVAVGPRMLVFHGSSLPFSASENLPFFYAPIRLTLVAGFAAVLRNRSVISGVIRRRTRLAFHATQSALREGDVLVWIGEGQKELVHWRELTVRGVRTIYYQAEPQIDCPWLDARDLRFPRNLSEAWDYSASNVRLCQHPGARKRLAAGAPSRFRHVPPGLLSGIPRVLPTAEWSPVVFLGTVGKEWVDRRGRTRYNHWYRYQIWRLLKQRLGGRLVHVDDVWDWAAFGKLVQRHRLFVTLRKFSGVSAQWCWRNRHLPSRCKDERSSSPFEAVRASLILSAGASLVSGPAFDEDENRFADVVTFASAEARNASSVADALARACSQATSAGGLSERAASQHEAFRTQFAAHEVFRRAAVADLFGKV